MYPHRQTVDTAGVVCEGLLIELQVVGYELKAFQLYRTYNL